MEQKVRAESGEHLRAECEEREQKVRAESGERERGSGNSP